MRGGQDDGLTQDRPSAEGTAVDRERNLIGELSVSSDLSADNTTLVWNHGTLVIQSMPKQPQTFTISQEVGTLVKPAQLISFSDDCSSGIHYRKYLKKWSGVEYR